jgi:hypothetical protein
MTKKEIEQLGIERGYHIATWLETPAIGDKIDSTVDYVGLDSEEGKVTKDCQEDYWFLLCSSAEEHARQYVDFSGLANTLNQLEDQKPYDVWAVFEQGLEKGYRKESRNRQKGK